MKGPIFAKRPWAVAITLVTLWSGVQPRLAVSPAFAQDPPIATSLQLPYLSYDEFKSLAQDLSLKVNLFHDAWTADPQAEFYGGTTRDFLYWVKGKFKEAKSFADAERIMQALRSRSDIDVREFLIGESDADIVTRGAINLAPATYGIRKIDHIADDRFNPSTPAGYNETHQGYIPIEKIRLGMKGFIPYLGDGVREIYDGRPTLHVASAQDFDSTYYAQQKLNHPVLLGLRYVRDLAINYYQAKGRGFPDDSLLGGIDPASQQALEAVVGEAMKPRELSDHLKNPQFVRWLNDTIHKAYRSYTNPTATHQLFQRFKLDQFVSDHSSWVEPINQYLFAKSYDPAQVRANLAKYGTTEQKLFVAPSSELKNLKLFHGTKTEMSFAAILRQGILPSTAGSAGPGLYGVDQDHVSFASTWGGSEDRVVEFSVKPDARIVDVTQGEGERVFHAFGGDFDTFAEAFGADIVRYPYSTQAYVVKNSAALERPKGLKRQVMNGEQLIDLAAQADTAGKALQLMQTLRLNQITMQEGQRLLASMPYLKQPGAFDLRKIWATALPVNVSPTEVVAMAAEIGLRFDELRKMPRKQSWSTRSAYRKKSKELLGKLDEFYDFLYQQSKSLGTDAERSKFQSSVIQAIAPALVNHGTPEENAVVRDLLALRVRKYHYHPTLTPIVKGTKIAAVSGLFGTMLTGLIGGVCALSAVVETRVDMTLSVDAISTYPV